MIFFKPTAAENGEVAVEATENGEAFGLCRMKIDGNCADVYFLEYDADRPYLVEGLIKSALNFAACKGVYMGSCSCENIDSFLEKMNFIKNNETYINDIPSILQGSCQNCHKK